MADFGHVKRHTKIMNGQECNFRSIFEYHWAEYCQLRMDNGEIENWYYEEETVEIEYTDHKGRAKYKDYTPDFKIEYQGDYMEFEETKGWLQTKDATKMRKYTEQYDTPLVIVFQKKIYGAQQRTAERLSKHVSRVIWEAEKEYLKEIKHLFDV
jgi:hypothetical protein